MANRVFLGINLALVVAVLLLAYTTLSMKRTLQSLADGVAANERAAPAAFDQAPVATRATLDPEQIAELRRLIRDELSVIVSIAADAGNLALHSPTEGGTAQSIENDRLAETAWQAVLVEQELDFYITRGTISATEMSVLQSEIAKLGPQGRTDAMRRLVGAINAGKLDGKL